MSEETKSTTPSQAPAMSREEWEAKLTELCNECDVDSFVSLKKEILDAIMSLQAEVERLRGEVENRGKCLDMATESLRLIDSFDADDFGDPGSEARRCLKAIEKARQPK